MESKPCFMGDTMNEEIKMKLYAVINTLDKVQVSGEQNLDMLLASIRTLRAIVEKGDE